MTSLLHDRFIEASNYFKSKNFDAANELLADFSEKISQDSSVFRHGPLPQNPIASVIIVSHRHGDKLAEALEAVAEQCPPDEWEIILVANGNDRLFETAKGIFVGFTGIQAPFPIGCSSGRNLGAAHATAPILLFLDDDGLVEPGCTRFLVSSLEETRAIAVRGRVVPHTTRSAFHYDLGSQRIPSFIDCEGVSAWRREPFLSEGGFHPLLAGHEGILLCARLWRHYGPLAFLYEPRAIFRHDYVIGQKRQLYELNARLVEHEVPEAFDIHRKMQAIPSNSRQLYLATAELQTRPQASDCHVSIITTARNARHFIPEFSECWKRQTHRDFQLVFVDDGSDDQTAEAIQKHWEGDGRLTLITRPFGGRGQALNVALAAAEHEICLIADVDDLSIPSRIARTLEFFTTNPAEDLLSFCAFNERDLFRIGPPMTPFVSDLRIRGLFHMPVSFPTLSWRKSRFTQPFDEILQAGVDCDWLHRNFRATSVQGKLLHHPAVYYRRHERQLTRSHYPLQRQARKALINHAFERVLGPLNDSDKVFIHLLIDAREASRAERRKLGAWVMTMLQKNRDLGIYPTEILDPVLVEALRGVKEIPTENERLRSLRLKAEQHIAVGQYKSARKFLRKAQNIRDDPEIHTTLRRIRWRAILQTTSGFLPQPRHDG